jgi:PilZ domain
MTATYHYNCVFSESKNRQRGLESMSILSKLLANTGLIERRRDDRLPAPDLEVTFWSGKEQNRARIKDISNTGVYVVTKERWLPGTDVSLTLESKSNVDSRPRPSVQLEATTIRHGEDGVGLTFVRNQAEADLWLRAMAMAAVFTAPDNTIARLRVVKMLVFLSGISSSIEIEIAKIMAGSFSLEGREKVIEIALGIENRLRRRNQPVRNNVPSGLILQLLEAASRAEDDNARALWVELLASSCLAGSDDDESLKCAGALSELAPVHLAILTAACEKALHAGAASGQIFSAGCFCTADEVRRITRIGNLVAVEHHLNHLNDLGLLEKTIKPYHCEQIERVNLTPTSFALQLYTRCSTPLHRADTSVPPELKIAI